MLRDAIIAATENMSRLYELSGGVDNDVEKGAFREFFVAQLIRPFVPAHFGVGSGVVVDSNGKQSRQTDVIIYDRRLLPPILLAGDRGIFPIDSVLRVIEVKSLLRASDYKTLIDAARYFCPPSSLDNPSGLAIAIPGRLKDEKGREQAIWPLYAVFAYKSDADRDEFERMEEQVPDGRKYISLIGVLNKGVWTVSLGQKSPYISNSPGEIGVTFLKMLLNRLEEAAKSRGEYRLQDWLK